MKLCRGTGEEVRWLYAYPAALAKCWRCNNFVNWKVIEKPDGFADISLRHFADGKSYQHRHNEQRRFQIALEQVRNKFKTRIEKI